MDLKEIGVNARNWVDSTEDRDCWRALVNAAFNLRVPSVMGLVILLICLVFVLVSTPLSTHRIILEFSFQTSQIRKHLHLTEQQQSRAAEERDLNITVLFKPFIYASHKLI